MEIGGITVIQKIKFSLLDDGVTMVYDEELLFAYPILRMSQGTDSPCYNAYSLGGYGDAIPAGEPEYVGADTFLNYWRRDMKNVPPGWYHFTNKEGLEVFLDNATGSGHIRAFDRMEDGMEWIEGICREMRHTNRRFSGRGLTAFTYPGFDGHNADGTFAKNTIPASYPELEQLCRDHGWLLHATGDQLNKLFTANECGWPIEHIATMILMCNDVATDYLEPGFAMEHKKILGVLTQYRDCSEYEHACINRRFENEKELKLDIQPGELQSHYYGGFEIDNSVSKPVDRTAGNSGPGRRH